MENSVTDTFIDSLRAISFSERHMESESIMEETAADYDGMDFSTTNNAFVDFISPLIPHGAHVADMGCGPGDVTILLAKKRPDLRVHGVDLSSTMLELAQSHTRAQGIENIEWKIGDITKSAFAPSELDFVYSQTTLHHLSDLRPFFTEMNRALKSSGGFVLRDLRRPASADLAIQWAKEASGGAFTRRQFELVFYSLRSSFTFEEMQDLISELQILGTLEISKNPDRYWILHRAPSVSRS